MVSKYNTSLQLQILPIIDNAIDLVNKKKGKPQKKYTFYKKERNINLKQNNRPL